MKHTISSILCVSLLALAVTGCDLFKIDNYDFPDTSMKGSIFDKDTRELVGTDVINGTIISFIETGYDIEVANYMRVKNDGTYENALLFSGNYKVRPTDRNFYQIDERMVTLKKGENVVDFEVIPYVRIKNAKIELNGTTVKATFKLEAPQGDTVKEIAIFESNQSSVGSTLYDTKIILPLDRLPAAGEEFTIEYNCTSFRAYIKNGKNYYFRVGALSSFPGAKYNYAPAVLLNVGNL